jgi:predicted esterase
MTAALVILATLLGGPDALPRGQIVDRVVCQGDAAQSYAVYLPSGYTPERRWPILYCFDPVARGRLPVERFREAAERFGWIVVGSNVSRNGRVEASMAAGAAMWADTHARFAIDDRRVYTAGFSGGARIATWSAIQCGDCIAGVVACGAGFPNGVRPDDARLPKPHRFAYFMTLGVDDFNFPELKMIEGVLAKARVPHHLARFDGGHDWLPASLAVEAIAFLEAHAMRTGLRAKDPALVEALWADGLASARAAEAAGRPLDAWSAWVRTASDLEGLRDTAEARRRAGELAASREVRDALAREAAEIKRQQRLSGEAAFFVTARADQDARPIAIQEFRRRIEEIRRAARAETDGSERRVARRALHQIFAWYYENGLNLSIAKKHAQAAELLAIAAEIAPRWPGVFYDLAAARARAGETRKAVAALGQALEQGLVAGIPAKKS